MMKKRSSEENVKLILASSSPRRALLLGSLNLDFSVRTSQVVEKPLEEESPKKFATRVAEEKAFKVGADLTGGLVIGCDTSVVLNGEIFGKPTSSQSAAVMLSTLSGKWHHVISGLALYHVQDDRMISGSSITAVKFFPLAEKDIAWYIASGEPMDKAGGYGIQGLGMVFIEKIEGSYTNVVGLPIELLRNLLKRMGIDLLALSRRPF